MSTAPIFKLHDQDKDVYALGCHEDTFRSVVLGFKLQQQCAPVWDYLIQVRAALKQLLSEADMLVPIPNSVLRVHHYGFSPSLAFAEMIRKLLGIPICRSALKMKRGLQQTKDSKSYGEKLRYLQTWMGPGKDVGSVSQKRVWLMDDVFNSGATLWTASEIIQSQNPLSIQSLVIAYTHIHGIHFTPCYFGYQWPHWPSHLENRETNVPGSTSAGIVEASREHSGVGLVQTAEANSHGFYETGRVGQ